jgi:hypothetical protein
MRLTHSTTLLLTLAAALTAQEEPKESPQGPQQEAKVDPMAAAWQRALANARQHKAPVLVFVLPDDGPIAESTAKVHRDAEIAVGMLITGFERLSTEPPQIETRRQLFLRQVGLLHALGLFTINLDLRPPRTVTPNDLQRMFALTVQVVAPASACGAKPGESVVLLRYDGQRIAGFDVDLTDREAFVRKVGQKVLDPDTLAARAANVDPDLQREVEEVRTMPITELFAPLYERKKTHLRENLAGVAPALVGQPDAALDPFLALDVLQPEPPHGTEQALASWVQMCGGCGMGYVPHHLNYVLKLLGP